MSSRATQEPLCNVDAADCSPCPTTRDTQTTPVEKSQNVMVRGEDRIPPPTPVWECGGEERRTAAAKNIKNCLYKKGGRCIHRDGVKRVNVHRMVTTAGPGGVKTTKLVKKWTWRCDLTRKGGYKLKQLSISSFLLTTRMTAGMGDSGQGEGSSSFDAVTVGQRSNDVQNLPGTEVTAERLGEPGNRK